MFENVLYALLVVAGVGLVAGVLLAVASKFFGIEEDEKVKNVRGALPGANCGACGFAGCDSYAEAVAKGLADANLCIPGGADTASQLSAIMGVEATVGKRKVAYVSCKGDCSAVEKTAIYDGIDTCKAAKYVFGGPNSCKYGCVGCGDCAAACPVNAIYICNDLAWVNPKECIGCGKCVKTCPKGIISFIEEDIKVAVACSNHDKGAIARKDCKNACIACKKCEKTCQYDAIKVVDNLAKIDYEKCTRCGECASVCPTGCIKPVDLINGKI